jgi:hypothetical protein
LIEECEEIEHVLQVCNQMTYDVRLYTGFPHIVHGPTQMHDFHDGLYTIFEAIRTHIKVKYIEKRSGEVYRATLLFPT